MEAAQIEPALLERNRQLRIERDDAREQRRRWQEASAADRMENVKLRAALTEIAGWRDDTLGPRPKESGKYDCPEAVTEAFDRGCRMAFYRCAERANQALKSEAAR